MGGTHEVVLPVRFGQVDYAGIMFYPRFFENFHTVFEDMFSARMGVPYDSILRDRRLGFPTVRIETDFRRPFRFGEPMRLVLDVLKLGNSSITFRYRGFNGDETEPSVQAIGTVVVLHLDRFETLPIPDDIRAVLTELLVDDATVCVPRGPAGASLAARGRHRRPAHVRRSGPHPGRPPAAPSPALPALETPRHTLLQSST